MEGPRYALWEKAGYFIADPERDAPTFSIVIPPPNVTGVLHIGHALDHTIIDAVVRRRRMQGYTTLWLPGMDHAGIATQNVVERELAKEGLSRHDLGREAFVERVWQWKATSGGKILSQMRRLGDSVDWTRERFTMDPGLSRAVQTIFKRLFDDGLIYRAERIINWCPRCLTALSDIEVDHSDDEGELVSIRYGDGADSIVVATTRAETMLGDTAVAVHGRRPLPAPGRPGGGAAADRPAIPGDRRRARRPAFGIGAVKVTPAHDPNDFEIGRPHNLPSLTALDERGVVTVHGPFPGSIASRPPGVVAALREEGRIVAEVPPYVHAVGHCQRAVRRSSRGCPCSGSSGSPRWPRRPATRCATAGPGCTRRDGGAVFRWVDDMHDWCISRQLWWGHRIPVWYGRTARSASSGGRAAARREGWRQDTDVLDTWFSSALWPFSTLGWPDDTATWRLLPDQRPRHRLRHPVLLGRPDDHGRPVAMSGPASRPRRRSVPGSRYFTGSSGTLAAARCPSRSATPPIPST